MKKHCSLFLILLLLVFTSCKITDNSIKKEPQADFIETDAEELIITSTAFAEEGLIPDKYTCKDKNVSPKLKWEGLPKETKSIVIICGDTDAHAGTWIHWLVYDIPGNLDSIPENADINKIDAKLGKNSWGKNEYKGPCPSPGITHKYCFKIYALDIKLNLESGKTEREIETAMRGHIVAKGKLIGFFKSRMDPHDFKKWPDI
ncbi:YbhB/YbcL family Raf kinase inhibitor-like protein [Candidatus Dependentiae bacterium]|nr:YbhB/YbcL family Raf kinase inhibitor-like protein [Candidatus Dependentiae bacterium]